MKRNPNSVQCGLLLAIAVGTGAVNAQPLLSTGNVPGYPGVTVSVPIILASATNIVGGQFDVGFSVARASGGEPVFGNLLSNHVIRSRQIAPGIRRFLFYSLSNQMFTVTNHSILARFPFTLPVTEYLGSGPITPSNPVLVRSDPFTLPVSLNAGTIFVRPVDLQSNGIAQFFLPSQPEQRYLIQASTNFVDWVNLSTNVALGSFLDLVDADAGNYLKRFYRAALFNAIVGGTLTRVARLAEGKFQLELAGLDGRSYGIEVSTNLLDWEPAGTAVVTNGTARLIDQSIGHRQRFYRAVSSP